MKKHIFYAISIIACVLSVCFFNITANATEFLDGDGSAENPYVIANKTQFYNALNYPDANFLLYVDLYFDADEILTFDSFSGSFDGNYHKISFDTEEKSNSVFGNISGTVKNLTISGTFNSAAFAKTLSSGGKISNCRNEGTCSSTGSAGGIVVSCSGIIELSSNAGDVVGAKYIGGIAAICSGIINECYNTGNITRESTETAYIGGICGKGYRITNCYNTGVINGVFSSTYRVYSAGIAGCAIDVINCYNAGRVLGNQCAQIVLNIIWVEINNETCSNCYYYDEDILTQYNASTRDSGKGCNYAELCEQTTFNGFDFENVWIIESGEYLMPKLRNNSHIEKNDTEHFAGGNGTFYNPYLISERQHLANIALYKESLKSFLT